MNKNVKSALKLAILTGFMAGTASKALAGDKAKTAEGTDKAHAEKGSCGGPNGCSGCSGKDAKKDKMKKSKMHGKAHDCQGKSCEEHGADGQEHDHAHEETKTTTTTTEKKK